jgi:hypothetical protein
MSRLKHQSLTPAAFALTLFLSALWGGNPVAIEIGLLDCPPSSRASRRHGRRGSASPLAIKVS